MAVPSQISSTQQGYVAQIQHQPSSYQNQPASIEKFLPPSQSVSNLEKGQIGATQAQLPVSNSPKKLSKSGPSSSNPWEKQDREPFRYRGYPAMSAWMASDDDFFVVRRFGKLGARVALYMQDQIVQLEERLEKEDEWSQKASHEYSHSGTFRHDRNDGRRAIMGELSFHLDKYQRFLLDHSQLKARSDATDFQVRNVKNWLHDSNYSINEKEADFINREGDLIPAVPRIKTPLRRFIDKFPGIRRISCFRDRKPNKSFHDFESKTTIYNKESRIDKFVTCAAIVLGLGMLIAPLWLLQHLSAVKPDLPRRLMVITIFMVAFTILIIVVTVAKPFEALAATAAYGAILMVYMQLNSYPSG